MGDSRPDPPLLPANESFCSVGPLDTYIHTYIHRYVREEPPMARCHQPSSRGDTSQWVVPRPP